MVISLTNWGFNWFIYVYSSGLPRACMCQYTGPSLVYAVAWHRTFNKPSPNPVIVNWTHRKKNISVSLEPRSHNSLLREGIWNIIHTLMDNIAGKWRSNMKSWKHIHHLRMTDRNILYMTYELFILSFEDIAYNWYATQLPVISAVVLSYTSALF